MNDDDKILKHDPLREPDTILREDFYGAGESRPVSTRGSAPARKRQRSKKPKPTHYKVVCISMYTKDIEELEEKVAELKRRGHTKANKSQLIRFALSQVDIDKLPPPV